MKKTALNVLIDSLNQLKIDSTKPECLTKRTGNPEWGAEPNKLYFVIKHGKRL